MLLFLLWAVQLSYQAKQKNKQLLKYTQHKLKLKSK